MTWDPATVISAMVMPRSFAMVPFLYVVYTLLVGLKGAIESEGNPTVKSMLSTVCLSSNETKSFHSFTLAAIS